MSLIQESKENIILLKNQFNKIIKNIKLKQIDVFLNYILIIRIYNFLKYHIQNIFKKNY